MGTEKQGGNQQRKSERLCVFALCYFSCLINKVFKYVCADENDSIEWEKTGEERLQGELWPRFLAS